MNRSDVFASALQLVWIMCVSDADEHDTVCAFTSTCVEAVAPPPVEWSVPHDGPIDKTFSVAPAQQLSSKEAEARMTIIMPWI